MTTIEIPTNLTVKIYIGLVLAILIFISIFVLLYFVGFWLFGSVSSGIILLLLGLLVIVIAIVISEKPLSGVLVKRKNYPEFVELIEDVSNKLGMRPPDRIYLMAVTDIFVKGVYNKTLFIGIASLRNITVKELRAIIAHEMGHIRGKDTVIGNVLWRMEKAIITAFDAGVAMLSIHMYLWVPALFIIIFFGIYRVFFKLVVLIYSRQVELRADFIASEVADMENFSSGLLNYSAFSTYFNKTAYPHIVKLLEENKAFVNVYKTAHESYMKEDVIAIKKQIINSEKHSVFSSHPRLKDRIKIKTTSKKSRKFAISMIKNHQEIEELFTRNLTIGIQTQIQSLVLYEDAKKRQGRCRYCGQQFRYLKDLLEHEAICVKNLEEGNKDTQKAYHDVPAGKVRCLKCGHLNFARTLSMCGKCSECGANLVSKHS
ncbi:MAG: M48 family metalloprotease [Candidatus Aenigmatarchaeota archaeon]